MIRRAAAEAGVVEGVVQVHCQRDYFDEEQEESAQASKQVKQSTVGWFSLSR